LPTAAKTFYRKAYSSNAGLPFFETSADFFNLSSAYFRAEKTSAPLASAATISSFVHLMSKSSPVTPPAGIFVNLSRRGGGQAAVRLSVAIE
jgi:hypothetical protein